MSDTVALLLSRQPLRPCGTDQWVKQTVAAINHIKANNETLLSSVGMPTWEMITAIGSMQQCRMRLIVLYDESDNTTMICNQLVEDFGLDRQRVELQPNLFKGNKREIAEQRDRYIIEQANKLYPISIRAGGSLDTMIADANASGTTVDDQFHTPHEKRTTSLSYNVNIDKLDPDLDKSANGRLIHWTRASNKKWPGESSLDFYRNIVESKSFPRTAFDTLSNIVHTQKILASSRHMPQNISTVSFSASTPTAMIPLMRWRTRYQEMSFEPYGIGIEKEFALQYGVLKVRYIQSDSDETFDDENVWLNQSSGAIGDWQVEQEFRYRGDLCLGDIPPDCIRLFCHTPQEAALLNKQTGLTTLSILG